MTHWSNAATGKESCTEWLLKAIDFFCKHYLTCRVISVTNICFHQADLNVGGLVASFCKHKHVYGLLFLQD